MVTKYTITLPKKELMKNFTNKKLTFSVGKMKSKGVCIVKPVLQLITINKQPLKTLSGVSWVVANNYNSYIQTFNLTDDELQETAYIQLKLEVIGITSTQPIYFTNLMLNEGSYTEYHQPNDTIEEMSIYFINNFFTNVYTKNKDCYLEIIRPNYDSLTTKTLSKSNCTVLAPHLSDEDKIDSPENIGLEYMNMSDQVIEILR